MSVIYDQYGIPRKLKHVSAVERLEKLKRESQGNPWPVIEECLTIWKDTTPTEWKSYLIYLDDIKETRRGEYAASDNKADPVHNGVLRYTLDIPEKVISMIRCLYDSSELPMDKEFFHQFARKFPLFKVAQKI